MQATTSTATKDGLRMVAYPGDTKILLAMSLDDDKVENFAGFAIWRIVAVRRLRCSTTTTSTRRQLPDR